MNLLLVGLLAGACAIMMIIERLGAPTTLQLSFRGDVKRETMWLAQYGQAVCTALAVVLMWEFDADHRERVLPVAIGVLATTTTAFLIKRLSGRVRPRREQAGKFLGPSLKHANQRESFPSSHSACAVALTVGLAHFYPQAAVTFWTLALITAALRYLLDAHWPSDVIAGIAVGYVMAHLVLRGFGM